MKRIFAFRHFVQQLLDVLSELVMVGDGDHGIILSNGGKTDVSRQAQPPAQDLGNEQLGIENPFFRRDNLKNIVHVPSFRPTC